MSSKHQDPSLGEELVKQDYITRDDLEKAHADEARTGTPWYKSLLQMQKISFGTLEDILRYEWHPPSRKAKDLSLGEALAAEGYLTKSNLEKALEEQRRTGRLLGRILLEQRYVTPGALGRVLAKQHGMDYAGIDETPSEEAALELVPEHIARKNQILPVFVEGDRLTVLIPNPQTRDRLKDLGVLLNVRIHAMLTITGDFNAELERRYAVLRGNSDTGSPDQGVVRTGTRRVTLDAVISPPPKNKSPLKTEEQTPMTTSAEDQPESGRFEQIAREASGSSVIKMVSTIIEGAVNSGATDIHLDPQEPEIRVRYRIDGILHDIMSIPENIELAVVSRIKIMADLDITETRHPQDGHISLEIGDREFDVRVATMPCYLGERIVLRLLDQSSILSGIKDLGLEQEDEKTLSRLIGLPYGMILVTGPTGSGKTTTLYAALNQKNVMTDSIVTLEDPVEYQLSGINQVQIDSDIGVTFANTLRAAMRQDIDVLLVGEIRDSETARIAIRAAMTGHLVFSTLHTNDASEAISTLRNMDIPSYLIASALSAVIAQRLVRTICGACKASFTPNTALLKAVGLPASVKKLYRGKGCDKCYHTGNKGRTGVFEIIEITPEIRHFIIENENTDIISKKAKLKTMSDRCRQKVRDGIIAPEEYTRVVRV
jgi:type IV pilus assembly protein PilB